VSAGVPEPTGRRAAPAGRGAAPAGLLCAHRHPPGRPGTFDETERRVSWDELSVARALVAEGHQVRALHERGGERRRPDFDVCGVPTEVKTLDRGASLYTVANAMMRGRAQGDVLIVDATRSGLSRRQAALGVRRFAEKGQLGRIGEARVIGAGFSLSYTREDLTRIQRRGPERGVGL
jgi:hypothetical protein